MANTNKSRIRLEQIKGGKLEAKANDASSVQLVAQVSGSDENYLKMDTRTGAELLELGEASNVGIKLEGALSGASISTNTGLDAGSASNSKVASQLAIKTYVDAHIIDEDNMASNSATKPASQQSVKAYVDSEIQLKASDLDFQGDSGGALSIDLDVETLDIAGGQGITTTGSGNEISVAVDAAQTGITSLLAADIKIGEDNQTKIDFETADEIHFYAANAEQVYVADGILGPQTDSDVDLGSASIRFKDAYVDTVQSSGKAEILGAIELGHASDTSIARASAGEITVEGNRIFRAGGADIPVADGGTGASTHTSGNVLLGNGTNAIASRAIGIANDNIVEIDGADIANGEYAKFTANGLQSKSRAEVIDELGGQASVSFSMNSQKITNLLAPANDQDAATKLYVDSVAEGLDVKKSVLVATTANITNANLTYNATGGTGNVGTLVASNSLANETIVLDGIPVTKVGQRVLFKDLLDPDTRNGIYEMTTVGVEGLASQLKIRVMGNYNSVSAGSSLAFTVDQNGAGGGEVYTITFSAGGTSSTSFSGSRTANIRKDAGLNNTLLAGEIRALFLSSSQFANNRWDIGDVQADTGGQAFTVSARITGQNAYDFSSVTANVDSAGEIFGTSVASDTSTGLASAVFTRSEDCNNLAADGSAAEFGPGHFTFTERGDAQADSGFVCVSDEAIPFQNAKTKVSYTQFSGAGAFSASNGVQKIGSDFQMNISSLTAVGGNLQASDKLAFMDDSDGADATKSVTFTDMVATMDGTGLTAGSGILAVDASQTQITAIGTIATGVWEATDIAVAHGGTGQSSVDDILVTTNTNVAGLTVSAGADTIIGGDCTIALDQGLANLAGVAMAANKMYFTSADNVHASATLSVFARTILDDADQAAVRTTLALTPGSDVLAFDAEIQKLAGMPAADELAALLVTEMALLDYGTAISSSVVIADADGIILHNADGAMEKIPASDLKAYVSGGVSKSQSVLSSTGLAANAPWNPGTNGMDAFPSGFSADDGAKTELFLNGMLIARGADANANMDYYNDSGNLKFEFDLLDGDVLQFIKRA